MHTGWVLRKGPRSTLTTVASFPVPGRGAIDVNIAYKIPSTTWYGDSCFSRFRSELRPPGREPAPLVPPRLLVDFFTVRTSTGSCSACLPRVPYDACAALWNERFSTPLGSSAAIAPARARRARRRARGQSHH